jgi:hypothetical protein
METEYFVEMMGSVGCWKGVGIDFISIIESLNENPSFGGASAAACGGLCGAG